MDPASDRWRRTVSAGGAGGTARSAGSGRLARRIDGRRGTSRNSAHLLLPRRRRPVRVDRDRGTYRTARRRGPVACGPPSRWPRTHTLEVELDHLAADGASVAILVTDLVTAYEARLAATRPRWAPLPVQYVDYALWERDTASRGRDTEFWTHALADFDPALLPSVTTPGTEPARSARSTSRSTPTSLHTWHTWQPRVERPSSWSCTRHSRPTVARLSGQTERGDRRSRVGSPVPATDSGCRAVRGHRRLARPGGTGDAVRAGLRDRCATSTSRRWDRRRGPIEDVLRSTGLSTPQVALAPRTSRSPRCTWVI
ncbi:hypothetical protein GS930_18965 [Rhodococcus hoagii]|nr:hypothetical protein [Prescottella equi]